MTATAKGGGVPELWNLAGLNDAHLGQVTKAVREIKFPWLWLRPKLASEYGKQQIPVRTSDLSKYGLDLPDAHEHEHEIAEETVHVHIKDKAGHIGHLISPPGRAWIAGLCWSNGLIEIDPRADGQLAKDVFASEAAHAVDFFWMTIPFLSITQEVTPMRRAIWAAFHGGKVEDHPGHSWWEPADYANQVGEGWMALFQHAFAPYEPWQGGWSHRSTKAMGDQIRPVVLDPQALVGLTGYMAAHRQSCEIVKGWRVKGWTFRQTRELAWQTPDLAVSWSGRRPCKTCRPWG